MADSGWEVTIKGISCAGAWQYESSRCVWLEVPMGKESKKRLMMSAGALKLG